MSDSSSPRLPRMTVPTPQKSLTYVTAFLKIRSWEQSPPSSASSLVHSISSRFLNDPEHSSLRSDSVYLDFATKLLSHPIPLVLFVDTCLVSEITQIRKKYGLSHLTLIVPITIESLKYYGRLDTFIENWLKNPVKNYQLSKFTPLYHLVINNKPSWIRQAIELNPFSSSRFAWLDFRIMDLSCPVDPSTFYRLKHLESSKIRVPMMNYIHPSEIIDKISYYEYFRGKVSAAFLDGPSSLLLKFEHAHQNELEFALNHGICPSDEQTYSVVIVENPSWFTYFYTDYGGSFRNFDTLKQDLINAHWFLEGAYNHKDYSAIVHVCQFVRKSLESCDPPISGHDIHVFWYKCYIAYWYLQKYEEAAEIIVDLFRLCESYPELNQECKREREFLRNNFNYILTVETSYHDEIEQRISQLFE